MRDPNMYDETGRARWTSERSYDRPAAEMAVIADGPTRQERRAERVANGRKMRVSGRSVLLLAGLLGVAASRRRVSRRKRGAR